MAKRNILFLDIDHTVADAAWRDGLIEVGDWDDYYKRSAADDSIEEMVQLVNDLTFDQSLAGFSTPSSWELIAVTARPEKWRALTIKWLYKNGINIDRMLMRPDDNRMSAAECKVWLLKDQFGKELVELNGANCLFIDDNEKVIAAMNALGISTLHFTAKKRIK